MNLSYLQSPQVHAAACDNPDLRGGYFVNTPGGAHRRGARMTGSRAEYLLGQREWRW
jgi:hypothetical protein